VDGRDKPGHDVATKCLSFFKHDDEVHCLSSVMPGLVPGIHVFLSASFERTRQRRNLCRNFASRDDRVPFFRLRPNRRLARPSLPAQPSLIIEPRQNQLAALRTDHSTVRGG
jgi:hypothetical protein